MWLVYTAKIHKKPPADIVVLRPMIQVDDLHFYLIFYYPTDALHTPSN